MPDISMCLSKDCPKKSECYRHEAEPNEQNQAYMDFKWRVIDGYPCCENFMEIRK